MAQQPRPSTRFAISSRRLGRRCSPRLERLEDRTLLSAGELDPSFGTGGKVITGFIDKWDTSSAAVALQGDDKLVVVGHADNNAWKHAAVARYSPDGSLDASFGNGGMVITDFGLPSSEANAVAVQADGKIVIVGDTSYGNGTSAEFALARYNADGSLDLSFGTGGKVITQFDNNVDMAEAVIVQADGKIIVAGVINGPGVGVYGLARYNRDGTLDPSFGTGGKVTTMFGNVQDAPRGMVLQPDGKIVVAIGTDTIGVNRIFAMARYNPDGTLDTGFGSGGFVTTQFSTQPQDDLRSIALQGDGKIILAGSNGAIELARYTPDGNLDPTFGTGGKVTAQLGGGVYATSVAIQADGKLVASGTLNSSSLVVARFTATGALDTTFGSAGQVVTSFGGGIDQAAAVVVQGDGKIVAVGTDTVFPTGPTSSAVARYNPDGSVDASFGQAGQVLTRFRGRVNTTLEEVALQNDGKIIAVGYYNTWGYSRGNGPLLLSRYTPDGQLDPGFGSGGRVTTDLGPGLINAHLAIDSQGRIIVVAVAGNSFLLRYNPDGSLDTTFATGGKLTINFGGTSASSAGAVTVQSDDKILVSGASGNAFALARYNVDGSLDSSFGTGGVVTTLFPSPVASASGNGILLQSDGAIIVTGDGVLARYTSTGSLDASFGNGGELILPAGFSSSGHGALAPDGRIFLTVVLQNGNGGVIRLNPDGSLDSSFGTGGVASASSPFFYLLVFSAVALTPSGKIVAQGEFGLVRFNADGSEDTTFGTGGTVSVDFSGIAPNATADFATDFAVQSDGRIILAGFSNQQVAFEFGLARYLTDNVGTPNQRFVEQVYWDLLRRAVDASGLASWSTMLDQGVPRTQVVAAIQNSSEYHTLVVGDLYQLVLGRPVDASGLSTWVSFLNRGGTAQQVEAFLLGSDEFFAIHGGDNNRGFLAALYQTVLQRSIDSSGAQTWVQVLQSGTVSRQAVAAAVLASLEADRLAVQSLYTQLLHRAADPSGLDTFTNLLQQGASDEQIAVILMTSTEYVARI